jgi:hypothetical protein
MRRKAGAPKGGRVHWLEFYFFAVQDRYRLDYRYEAHDYKLQRNDKKRYDLFLIIKKSRGYRIAYFDNPTLNLEYASFSTAEKTAEYIHEKIKLKDMRESEFEEEQERERHRIEEERYLRQHKIKG